jgi:hypothetical protein
VDDDVFITKGNNGTVHVSVNCDATTLTSELLATRQACIASKPPKHERIESTNKTYAKAAALAPLAEASIPYEQRKVPDEQHPEAVDGQRGTKRKSLWYDWGRSGFVFPGTGSQPQAQEGFPVGLSS